MKVWSIFLINWIEQKHDVVGPLGPVFFYQHVKQHMQIEKEVNWCFYFQQHLQSYLWQNIPAFMLFYIHNGEYHSVQVFILPVR